jgi:hypothetical protein
MGGHGLWKEIDCSLYFVVIAKVSYLPWVNYHQPHENTLIKKKERQGKATYPLPVWHHDAFI